MHDRQSSVAGFGGHDGHRRRGAECGVLYAEAYWLVEAKPGVALLPVMFLKKKS